MIEFQWALAVVRTPARGVRDVEIYEALLATLVGVKGGAGCTCHVLSCLEVDDLIIYQGILRQARLFSKGNSKMWRAKCIHCAYTVHTQDLTDKSYTSFVALKSSRRWWAVEGLRKMLSSSLDQEIFQCQRNRPEPTAIKEINWFGKSRHQVMIAIAITILALWGSLHHFLGAVHIRKSGGMCKAITSIHFNR